MYLILIIIITVIIGRLYYKYASGKCTCTERMDGKVVIITGSNAGIGFETAKNLAQRGARVILACRNETKAARARDEIIQATGNKNVVSKHLDLTSFKDVQEFVADILATEPRLDVLINNAGSPNAGNDYTSDGITVETQVNHFSPFLLTMSLLPLLKASAPSRIINVSSVMHMSGAVDVDSFHKKAPNYVLALRVYSNTKLANLLFTRKLSAMLAGTGVTVNSLHPGAVQTEIFRYHNFLVKFLIRLLFKTAEEGAQTSIHLAVSESLAHESGKYFIDCREATPAANARDDGVADTLWKLSEQLVPPY